MPINRVPVVHKFGIISQTQRVELEKRIAKKAFLEARQKLEARQPPEPRPLPFEVTEEFVYKFNDSSQEDREKLEDTAMKMLIRLKRLAGLRKAGEAHYVDLPRALVDLALLAQCRSPKLEEACLEALIASLDQALFCDEQILSLFYLAKSGVHWLKKDAGNHSVLRSSQLLLLKMTRLVFIRLYCHHLLDQLKEYEDQRKSLGQYLKGFTEKTLSFGQFPGAYLSVRFICEAGRVICSSTASSTREELIQNESSTTAEKRESMDTIDIESKSMDKQENRNGQKLDLKDETQDDAGLMKNHLQNKKNHDKDCTSGDGEGGLFSKDNVSHGIESGRSLFLQCSVNVWHAVNHDPEALNDTLCDLLESATRLSHEQWLDLVLAFDILADASCNNVRVLEAFQYFMSLGFSPVFKPVEQVPRLCEICYSSLPTSPEKKACNSTSFRDNLSKNENLSSVERNTTASLVETLQDFVGLDLTQEPQWTLEDVEQRKTQDSTTGQPQKLEQEANIHVDSYALLPRTERSHPGYRWPWELIYTFCECLTNVCLQGACADIQKFSLLGMRERKFKRHKNGMDLNSGLVQFLQYDDDEDSWKVRYGAVKSLVRICQHYSNDVAKEGVTNAAWSSLMESQSSESEPRVLEAMKIAKVEAELEKKLTKDHIRVSLWTSRIASALTPQYHIISTGSDTPTSATIRADRSNIISRDIPAPVISRDIPAPSHPERCKKPTLRQEVKLSNACLKPKSSYNTRMNLELRAVIEDQWKKQLIREMEDEIKKNIKQLKKEREQELQRK